MQIPSFRISIWLALLLLPVPGVSVAGRLDNVPLLKDGVTSETYSLEYIQEIYKAHITFDPTHKFFILERSGDYIRVDASGNITASLNKPSINSFRIPNTPFVIDTSHIYDFTEPTISRARFVEANRFDPILAEGGYELLYNRAEAVAYGVFNRLAERSYRRLEKDELMAFIKLDGLWSITSISLGTDVDYHPELGYDIPFAPQKPERMVLLKDVNRGVYSHVDDRIRTSKDPFVEQQLSYAKLPQLKLKSYRSEYISDREGYSSIPIELAGHAVHEIKVGSETLLFKEIAKRSALRPMVDGQLNLFVLPEAYSSEVPVSFLEFIPHNNYTTGGSKGLYVLKPKE